MAIYRVEKDTNYVVLDKGFLNDPDLSWQAKGLLAYMLSLPDDWEFHINDLKNRSKNGRDATKSTVNELKENGYITKTQTRKQGKFSNIDFTVHEVKQPLTEKPLTGNPSTDKPSTENPSLLNNNSLLSNECTNATVDTRAHAREDDNQENKDRQDNENPFVMFQNCFGSFPSPVNSQEMNDWIDSDGMEDRAVAYAIWKAARNGAHFGYARGIIRNWLQKDITTYEQATSEEQRRGKVGTKVSFDRRSDGRSTRKSRGSQKVKIPEPNIAGMDTSIEGLF